MIGKNATMFFGLSICALMVSILLAAWGFPKIVNQQIKKNIQLENSSQMFKYWRKLPMPMTFRITLFNVTNVDEIMEGQKPILQEVGPFVYKEYRERTILGYGENDTIKYTLKKTFFFDKEASGSLTEDQEVTIINYPFMNAILTAHDLMPSMIGMLSKAMTMIFMSEGTPFTTVKAKDLLFDGIFLDCTLNNSAIPLICGKIKADPPPVMRPSSDGKGFYFSMFNFMNNTDLGPFEMVRGTENIQELGHIVSYQDKQNWDMTWKDPYCGMINGSDATIYPPIDESNIPERIYYFEPEVCRSTYVSYVGPREMFNMTLYYYEIDRMLLASKSANPDNKCFCQRNWSSKHDGCLMMGVMNLMPCKGAPAILSLPHFYLASDELLDYVGGGLKPDREKHSSFVYIEPKLGTVLKGFQRIQFNIELRNIPDVPQLANVQTGLFPFLWMEEGVDKMPDDLLDEIRQGHTILGYVEAVRCLLLVVSAFLCIGTAVCVVRSGSPVWPMSNNLILNARNSLDINKGH